MARGDLRVVGPQGDFPFRAAASDTRWEAGEPIYSDTTLSSGADTAGSAVAANKYELALVDIPVIGTTQKLAGIATKGALPFSTGTLIAQKAFAARPVAWIGQIRGKAETAASVDTDSEIQALIGDATLIDYNATGASDGGELYTIKETASVDTSGLTIVDGNPTKRELFVVVDGRAYRGDVS